MTPWRPGIYNPITQIVTQIVTSKDRPDEIEVEKWKKQN